MNPFEEEKLARLVHRTLRDLPPREAPRTLESRVLAELERQAALPWWHKSYAHWPAAVRALFLVVMSAIAAGFVIALFAVMHRINPAQLGALLVERFDWLAVARQLGDSAAVTANAIWRSIPPLWLYGALVFVGACYAMLIGLGAAAYRTFHVQR